MLSSSLRLVALASLLASALGTTGCSLIVSSTLDGKGKDDAGEDGAADGDVDDGGIVVESCKDALGANVANFTVCGDTKFCFAGECVPNECGDGVLVETLGEQCGESGAAETREPNGDDSDGCTDFCQFPCDENEDCSDGMDCTGEEICTGAHVCEAGTPLDDDDPCTAFNGNAGACQNLVCVPSDCGNHTLDEGEECDPSTGTTETGDGNNCTTNCLWVCDSDADCSTDLECSPATCADHYCTDGTPVVCTPDALCENPIDCSGGQCAYSYITDADRDGYSGLDCANDDTDGAPDCDDGDSNTYPGAAEICDDKDNDCDGQEDEGTIDQSWYPDADGDGYGASNGVAVEACAQPANTVSNNADCQDSAALSTSSSVYPGQKDVFQNPRNPKCSSLGSQSIACWDFNCSGAHRIRNTRSSTAPSTPRQPATASTLRASAKRWGAAKRG
jgi:hypothetical protein